MFGIELLKVKALSVIEDNIFTNNVKHKLCDGCFKS